MCSNYLVLAIM